MNRPLFIPYAQSYAVVITEVEFSNVTVQMLLATMLIDAFHAALEHAVKILDGVGMHIAANIFIGFMTDALMGREVIAQREIVAAFIGHHRGFLRNIGLDNWNDIGGASSLDMERANLPAVTINERQDRILVAVAATLDRTFFTAGEGFIRFNYATDTAHWGKTTGPERLTDAMAHEPCAFERDPQGAMQLVRAHALFAGTNYMDRIEPIAHLDMAFLENSPDFDGEWFAASIALIEADPIAFGLQSTRSIEDATMRAKAPVDPKARFDIGIGGGFIIEVWSGENGLGHGENSLCRNHIPRWWSCQV